MPPAWAAWAPLLPRARRACGTYPLIRVRIIQKDGDEAGVRVSTMTDAGSVPAGSAPTVREAAEVAGMSLRIAYHVVDWYRRRGHTLKPPFVKRAQARGRPKLLPHRNWLLSNATLHEWRNYGLIRRCQRALHESSWTS